MPWLTITLFGNPTLSLDGAPVSGFPSHKINALIYYLAATHRSHTRAWLAGLLWPESPDATAMQNLRTILHHLRLALPNHFAITRQDVSIGPFAEVGVDIWQFENALHRAIRLTDEAPRRLALLHQATALYRGEFLEGFHITDSSAYEEWVAGLRDRYQRLVMQAYHDLLAACVERGEYLKGIEYATRLLQLDPWDEVIHRQLMTMLARNGQSHAALAHYERFVQDFGEQMGAAPEPATSALFRAIQSAELVTAPPPIRPRPALRHNIPATTTEFVGREAELARLLDRMADPLCRLITITGIGGIGKTSLALHMARQLIGSGSPRNAWPHHPFVDGVFYVSLAGVETSAQPAQPPADTLLDALRVVLQTGDGPKEQVMSALAQKQALLILDNCEPAMQSAEFIGDLLAAAGGLKVVATARERLGLRGEWLLPLAGLPYPMSPAHILHSHSRGVADTALREEVWQTLHDSEGYDAVRFFVQCARRVQPNFAFTDENVVDIVHICAWVEGIPLALELAAAWTRVMSCAAIAQEMERSLDFLSTTLHDVPARHRSLRAVFDHSWRLLSPVAQQTLAQLAVFRNDFDRAGAEAVTGADLATLGELVDKSWLQARGQDRFALHELARQYALDQLPLATLRATRDRHAATYIARLVHQAQRLRSDEQASALAELVADGNNLRSAWHWAAETGNIAVLADGVITLGRVADSLGWYNGVEPALEQAATRVRQLAETADPAARQPIDLLLAQILFNRARLLQHYKSSRLALTLCEEAFEILAGLAQDDQVEDVRLEGLAHFCSVLLTEGDYTRAHAVASDLLAGAVRRSDLALQAYAHYFRGLVANIRGCYAEASAEQARGIELAETLGDPRLLAMCRHWYGRTLCNMGQLNAAEELIRAALDTASAAGDWVQVAQVSANLGYLHLFRNEYDRARQAFSAVIEYGLEMDHRQVRMRGINGLAAVAFVTGDFVESERLCREAQSVAEGVGRYADRMDSLLALGLALAGQGKPAEAWHYYLQVLRMGHPRGLAPYMLATLYGLTFLEGNGAGSVGNRMLRLIAGHPATAYRVRIAAQTVLARASADTTNSDNEPLTLDAAVMLMLERGAALYPATAT